MVNATSQQQGLVEELANFCGQGERAPGAGMAACACGDGDKAIDTRFGGFFGMPAGGDIVEHQAAVAVYGIDHFLYCPRLVITIGTRCATHKAKSACRRGLVGWTIRLTA